ncbi:MAG: DUF447 family protein [Gemmataceae bacterium]
MVLEGLVTTLDAAGAMHLAPMGPSVDGPDFRRFLLRPFPASGTYRNLLAHGEGVLHVTDDVLLLARAAIGNIGEPPPHRPATRVRGWVLSGACRAYEFRVAALDDTHERVHIECEVVHVERLRDFFGFNRAKHAVVEAAILATRVALLPAETIRGEFARLRPAVEKTGGPDELAAFALLAMYVGGAV